MASISLLLLRALQKLISRCSNSVHAVLYLFRSLWRLLRRGQLSRGKKSGRPGGPQLDRIHFEVPLEKPSTVNTSIVCASLQPGIELQYTQGNYQPQTPGRPASYHGSLHLPEPYTPNSHSSPNLGGPSGGLSLRNFASTNGSRTSHLSTTSTHPHPQPRSLARGHSPSWRSIHRGVTGQLHRSDSPVPSVRVEDPNGDVAAAPSPDGTLTADRRSMFPMAPPWIERYDRGIKLYALLQSSFHR
jgi:hypothetical protein